MKKLIALFISLVMCVCMFSGCDVDDIIEDEFENTKKHEKGERVRLPIKDDMEFMFSSGAGGWRTELSLDPDGEFEGEYTDSEMGSTGEGYPRGTLYECEFEGYFTDIKKINDYSYSMKIGQIALDAEPDREWIEDGILHIASIPYGIEGGEEFIFYTPDTPISELDEGLLMWWPGRFEEVKSDTLSYYAIYNVKEQQAFFSY